MNVFLFCALCFLDFISCLSDQPQQDSNGCTASLCNHAVLMKDCAWLLLIGCPISSTDRKVRRIGSWVPYLKKEEARMRLFSSVATNQMVSVKLGEYPGPSHLSSFSGESTGRCFASRLWIGGEALALC